MRPLQVVAVLSLACLVACWTNEDYEIFGLNDNIRKDLGESTTFYLWLGIDTRASAEEISKAYRKLLRKLHPDKLRKISKSQRKNAEARFQRLSLVGNILRDRELKKRYDYFLRNGFPKWKGTSYYYSRFKPGILLTLFVLYVLVGSFHYVALRINRRQDYKRIVDLKSQIVLQAWNGTIIPPADGSARKVFANGRDFHVSPTGEVSLMDQDDKGNLVLSILDENDINVIPSVRESLLVKIPFGLWNITGGKLTGTILDTLSSYENPRVAKEKEERKKTAKKPKGKKIELPNGKVMYSRKK